MAELLTGTAREHITRLWPEHLAHLAPEGNRMGQGSIDPDEGVVCNCGEVLGFPAVQDEADYVSAEPDQPDTSGVQTGEPESEPDWTPEQVERENYQGPDMLEGSSAPGNEETADEAGWNDLVNTPVAPLRGTKEYDRWMRERFERNQFDSEARAHVYGMPDVTTDEAQADWLGYRGPNPHTSHVHVAPSNLPPGEPPEPALPPAIPDRDHGVVPAEDPIAARVVVIDPTLPYGPRDVEEQLLDIAQRVERGVHYQRYWEEREFIADTAYTQKAARVRLEDTSGAKDIRDARVAVKCAEEWAELRLCQVMVRAVRETMHNLRSLQSGYQTVARSVTESTRVPAGSRGRP